MLTALAALTLLASCSDDDDSSKPQQHLDKTNTSKDAPTTTTTAAPNPEADAKTLYKSGLDYFNKAAATNPPNPQDANLGKYFTGQARQKMVGNLVYLRQHGNYVKITETIAPKVVSVTADQVLMRACFTDTLVVFSTATGKHAGAGKETINWRVRVVKTPDGWRVSELVDQTEPCPA